MGISQAVDLLRECLTESGWRNTVDSNVLVKNDCYFHFNNSISDTIVNSFSYNEAEIGDIVTNDFNCGVALHSKAVRLPKLLLGTVDKAHFYVEKYGWLLYKGKYATGFSYLTKELLEGDSKNASDFKQIIRTVNKIADMDYVSLRGVKQHLVHKTKAESILEPHSINDTIHEGAIIQIQEDSSKCDVFKAGTLFKIMVIMDSAVVVTAIDTKGNLTSRNYKIEATVFLDEAVNHNMKVVELLPGSRDVDYELWETFSTAGELLVAPQEIESFAQNGTHLEILRRAYSSNYNFTPLLNSNASVDAMQTVLGILAQNYFDVQLCVMRLRESNSKLYERFISLGYDVRRFLDDSYDSFALEEALEDALKESNAYKKKLLDREVSESTAQYLCKYHFKYGKDIDIRVDETTRWQFLAPYYFAEFFDNQNLDKFSNLIKMYGTLIDDRALLKVDYLDAEDKGVFLRNFKTPIDFDFNGENWNDMIFRLLSGATRICFSNIGIGLYGDSYTLYKDYNGFFILSTTDTVIWRSVIINEKVYIMSNSNLDAYL